MKSLLIVVSMLLSSSLMFAQTTWQVCVAEPDAGVCGGGQTGVFTPGNLVIQQGDMIEFTTHNILLGGYSTSWHDIQFSGSPTNNVMLQVPNVFQPPNSVTTPPFNTPGVFPMECVDFNHCTLSAYSCTGYSVTVLSNCTLTASFTTTPALNVCAGEVLNFTNTSTGATNYNWELDGFTFSTMTDAVLSFASAGSYEIELFADDGAGCIDSSSVTINVDPDSDAGMDDSLGVCNIEDSLDLNTLVTGDTGGFWEETTSSGQFNATSGTINYHNLTPGSYYFDYIVPGVGVCPNDTATMIVTTSQQPDLVLNVGSTPIANYDSVYVDFTPNGVLPGAYYLWDFCDGNLAQDTLPFYYSWGTEGNYCVCVQVNNQNGCVETFCDSSIVVFDASTIGELVHEELELFPNPTTGNFSIDLTSTQSQFELIIVDQKGAEVFRDKITGGSIVHVDPENIEKGLYHVSIVAPDYIATQKLIIE